jgi:eukaryotic-like serine/threonine-protein kinase
MADWARLKELYQLAAERPAAERAAFIESVCGGDEELLRELQSLVAAGEAADSFLESTPDMVWAARAAAMAGTTLGHYRLDSLLGRGGMGLVYRATDTRLGRTVAVKIVRPEMASTPEARRRLMREAKAASALKHQNIVTVYDADQAAGRDFLVMEFVEGQTLAERLSSGPMPLAEAMNCAIQVAAALESAHASGILHRDLKPQNVMVETSGTVKVVDFGLAKLSERNAPEHSQALETHAGAVIGTAAYMSPEQAEGRPADARSDIFCFGALLYEMLSGRRAFAGASPASTLAAVLRDDPEPLDSPAGDIVSRCLQKSPERRFQTATDLRSAIEAVRAGKRPISRKWLRYAATSVAVAAVMAGVRFSSWPRMGSHQQQARALFQVTKDSGLTTEPALSRDGRLLAYASDRGGSHLEIWVQPVDGGAARRLTSGAADQHEPSFSPDGSLICYRSEQEGGGVWTVRTAGGAPKLLMRGGRRPRYSPDGKWIACWTGVPGTGDPVAPGSGRIFIIPAAGGEPRQLEQEFAATRYPLWAPDARHILFAGARSGDNSSYDWWVTGLSGGAPIATGARPLLLEGHLADLSALPEPAAWRAEGGGVLFSTSEAAVSNLWEVPISPWSWKISGNAVRVTMGSGLEDHPAAASGVIAFAGLVSRSHLWSLERGKLDALTEGSAAGSFSSISAGGNLLVVVQAESILARDLSSGIERVLVKDKGLGWAKLTPDGSRVFYTLSGQEQSALYSIPSGGGQAIRHLDSAEKPWDVSGDGSRILAMTSSAPRGVRSVDLRSGQRSTFLSHPTWNLYWATFSRDEKWVAFTAKTGPDRSKVYATPFRDGDPSNPDEWVPVTDGAGADTGPQWSPDGKRIYFFSDRDGFRCIWFARFENGRASAAMPLRHFHTQRQNLNNIPISTLQLAASRDRLVFDLNELTGNIWLAR